MNNKSKVLFFGVLIISIFLSGCLYVSPPPEPMPIVEDEEDYTIVTL
tara:strand:+ start:386 stop:526 length:141 start_codon:yes stop_codon:yes gene_type:complete